MGVKIFGNRGPPELFYFCATLFVRAEIQPFLFGRETEYLAVKAKGLRCRERELKAAITAKNRGSEEKLIKKERKKLP